MPEKGHTSVIIIGGGISGLSTAWYLNKANVPFTLIEKGALTGGVIQSESKSHSVFDFGPNTIRDKDGSIRALVDELGLSDEILSISEAFKTRYIVRNKKLSKIAPNPLSFISSSILSTKGKLRLLQEPFRKKTEHSDDESIASFLERRIGKEAVDYLVDPFFSGIYAGDIHKQSKKTLLEKLSDFEQEFGSIFKGFVKTKREPGKRLKPSVISFKKGIQTLTNAITDQLSDHIVHTEVLKIDKSESGYEVHADGQVFQTERIISCVPAHQLSRLIEDLDSSTSQLLNDIKYPPMLSLQVVYRKDDIRLFDEGFGFLVPRKEQIRLLGAIWKTQIFPEHTNAEYLHFNLMAGGSHDTSLPEEDLREVEKQVLDEFSKLMNITVQPIFTESRLWEKAIPQFEVGYEQVKHMLKTFQEEHPGFHIGSNFVWGVSVPDCIAGAKRLASNFN